MLKSAEVLTRYVAAVALASHSSICEDESIDPLAELDGNLAFGHFLSTVQQVSQRSTAHLVGPLLAQGFKRVRRNNKLQPGKADEALVLLLEIRNRVGHQLSNLDEARAISIERENSPSSLLIAALDGCSEILSLPLFIVENQRYSKECLVGLRLLLMGESSDPLPEEIRFQHDPGGFSRELTPYVAVKDYVLALPPSILWDVDDHQKRFDLFFIDRVETETLQYRTIEGTYHPGAGLIPAILSSLLAGESRQVPDKVRLANGLTLSQEWRITRQHLEETVHRSGGRINWSNYDRTTIELFARLIKLPGDDPEKAVKEVLLNGRDTLEQHELRQLNLLFGISKVVRSEIHRDLLDLRIVDEGTGRPLQRELIEDDNLLIALQKAVRFLSRELEIDGEEVDGLTRLDGSFDYIAIREILVNQVVHQDYQDHSAAAQIEIYETKVSVFNTGHSLVDLPQLLEGGKSQSRNPLIARALRLAGFAEISGSGIRALQRACLKAQRPAPVIKSDRQANTFTLVLSWGEKGSQTNAYWHSLLGVSISQQQANVLDVINSNPSVTIPEIEAQSGLDIETIVMALEFLEVQVLIVNDDANYRLSDHLREQLG